MSSVFKLKAVGKRDQTNMLRNTIVWMPGDSVGNDVMEADQIVLDRMKFGGAEKLIASRLRAKT